MSRNVPCPVCGQQASSPVYCSLCGWEDVREAREHPGRAIDENKGLSLEAARQIWASGGPETVRAYLFGSMAIRERIRNRCLLKADEPYVCACCGFVMMDATDDICDRCYWERSPYGEVHDEVEWRPNYITLKQARQLVDALGPDAARLANRGGGMSVAQVLALDRSDVEEIARREFGGIGCAGVEGNHPEGRDVL